MNIIRAIVTSVVLGSVVCASGQAVWPTTQPTRLITHETGRIIAIGENQFEMKSMASGPYVDPSGKSHESYIVHVPDNSKIYIDGDEANFKDLKKGLDVGCSYRASRRGLPASLIVNATTSAISGTIVKTEDKDVFIALLGDAGDGAAKKIPTDEHTRISIQGHHGDPNTNATIEDLHSGDVITAFPASGAAKKIIVLRRRSAVEPSTQP